MGAPEDPAAARADLGAGPRHLMSPPSRVYVLVLPLWLLPGCNRDDERSGTRSSVPQASSEPPHTLAQGPSPTGEGDAAPAFAKRTFPPTVELDEIVGGLEAPTDLVTAPDGTLFVLEQAGIAYRIDDGALVPVADLRERVVELDPAYDERGLLGMAFDPRYPDVRRVWVYYSAPLREIAPDNYDHTNVLSRFVVNGEGKLDLDSERKLIELDWPAPNHDGGTLVFGPDQMLYVSMGDGGLAGDVGLGHPPAGNGQDWTTLMGSILRIDPHRGKPYGIPKDNPFVGKHPGADEIWAYGLRNPYSFSFDPKDGRMFAGDVGQDLVEEVDIIERGHNYGWSIKEGRLCFSQQSPLRPPETCRDVGIHGEPLVAPIVTYAQPDSPASDSSDVHGISVIGGHVYRGSALPDLQGAYVFGDWSRKMDAPEGVLLVAREGRDGWSLHPLPVRGRSGPHLGLYVRGFGQDDQGEIYVLTSERQGPSGQTGVVWRLAPT